MNIYQNRRFKLINSLKDNSVVYIFSGLTEMFSLDEEVPFKVNYNFHYLTGIDESNMVLEIKKFNNVVSERLFIEYNDPFLVKWVGAKVEKDEAREISGIYNILNIQSFYDEFQNIFNNYRSVEDFNVYLDLYRYVANQKDGEANKFAKYLTNNYPSIRIHDIYRYIAELRIIKDNHELELIRHAIANTNHGILRMLDAAKPGMNESVLEGYFNLGLMEKGSRRVAFTTICAAGKNAVTLHYHENTSIAYDNELVLVDLGAEYKQYKADISRTFPINGKFTDRQKELYNLVLSVQKLVISSIKEGMTLRDLNQIVIDYYKEELPKHNLNKPVQEYYFHAVSHQLGLDTHDIDFVRGTVKLRKGMVFTVEPGIYVEDEGIGIRIEDDVYLGDTVEVLSKDIIKEVDDIENYMNKQK